MLFGPHWDMVETWIPGAQRSSPRRPAAGHLIAIDEETRMSETARLVGVGGRRSHLYHDGEWVGSTGTGQSFTLPMALGRAQRPGAVARSIAAWQTPSRTLSAATRSASGRRRSSAS
jgi:hypothetical protein